MEIVLATRNPDKVREISELLNDINLTISSLLDYPDIPPITEDGTTLYDNAIKKAKTVAKLLHKLALADDTGLEVDALAGQPGIHTARFAGPNASYADNRRKLLDLLEGIPWEQRTARFRTVVALVHPDGRTVTVEGKLEGYITFDERGAHGFGYDPIFYVPELGKTLAELPLEAKNRISHRARAINKIKPYLLELMNSG